MLLKNYKFGIMLFLIQVISSILIGTFMGLIARIKKTDFCNKRAYLQERNLKFGRILTSGCNDACKSLLGMCALIILFFGIISIVNELGIINYISNLLLKINIPLSTSNTILLSLIEMTQSCISGAKNLGTPYYIYSWIIGFGGLCAHTQIIAQLSDCPFEYGKFLIMRIINGLLTCVATALIIGNPEISLQTFASIVANQNAETSKASPNHFASIVLLIFCVFFTISINFPKNLPFICKYIKRHPPKNERIP